MRRFTFCSVITLMVKFRFSSAELAINYKHKGIVITVGKLNASIS